MDKEYNPDDFGIEKDNDASQPNPWDHLRMIFLDLVSTGFSEKQALSIVGTLITAQITREAG